MCLCVGDVHGLVWLCKDPGGITGARITNTATPPSDTPPPPPVIPIDKSSQQDLSMGVAVLVIRVCVIGVIKYMYGHGVMSTV